MPTTISHRASAAAAPLLTVAFLLAADASADDVESTDLGEAVRAHIEFLADDLLAGREAGTPGYEIAARYVAARFRLLGLEPAEVGNGYLLPVPLLRNRIDPATAEVAIHRADGSTVHLEWQREFLMGGDPLRERTSVRAPVVFAGYGISAPELDHDDWSGLDVEGKIVLVLSGAPAGFPHNQRAYYSSSRQKRDVAAGRGAAGLLTFPTTVDDRRVPWERRSRNAGHPGMRWLDADGKPHGHTPGLLGEAFLSQPAVEKLLERTGRDLERILAAAGRGEGGGFALPIELTLARQTAHERTSSSNVAALVRGTDPELADQVVLYTAHLDHVGLGTPRGDDPIYNGAYDNAAGVAVLLETARLFAETRPRPRRSVLFLVVTAEEKGLLGSDYYAHHPTVPIERIVADINLDMPLFLHPVTDLVAYGAEHSSLAGPVARAVERNGFRLAPDPMPEEVIFVRSDQYSFVRQGVPAVFLMSGYGSADPNLDGQATIRNFLDEHYHMPSDDTGRPFDRDAAGRFTRANFQIGLEVANEPHPPAWNPGDFFGERFGR